MAECAVPPARGLKAFPPYATGSPPRRRPSTRFHGHRLDRTTQALARLLRIGIGWQSTLVRSQLRGRGQSLLRQSLRYRGAQLIVGRCLRRDTKEIAHRIDRAPENAVDEIDGTAANQREDRLRDRARSTGAGIRRRMLQKGIVHKLRQYDPGKNPHDPARPVGALESRIVGPL
jgi:hypothetical protein